MLPRAANRATCQLVTLMFEVFHSEPDIFKGNDEQHGADAPGLITVVEHRLARKSDQRFFLITTRLVSSWSGPKRTMSS